MKKKYVIMGAQMLSVLVLVAMDQVTKYLAVNYLRGTDGIDIIEGVLRLQYLENFGAAFGILQNATWLFLVLTMILLVMFLWLMYRIPDQKRFLPLHVLLVFFMAGAVGNFIDRIVHAYVIDFIYISLIDFPIFNIADIYVTCACIVFAFYIIFIYKDDEFSFLKRSNG
ncbi:MAG: signal peptidase II [Lachnospiraceae bacterium]